MDEPDLEPLPRETPYKPALQPHGATGHAPATELAMLRNRLRGLQEIDPEYDLIAWIPVVVWGLMTVIGCLVNGEWLNAGLWLAITATVAGFQRFGGAQFRPLAVIVGFATSLLGSVLLGLVGKIWVMPTLRVIDYIHYLLPHRHHGYESVNGVVIVVPAPPFSDWASALAFLSIFFGSLWCAYFLWSYLAHDREKSQLLDRIEEAKEKGAI